MEDALKKILEIMQSQLFLFQEIKVLLSQKTDVLIKRHMEELESITEKENEFANKLEILERERSQAVETLAVALNLQDLQPDISALEKALPKSSGLLLVQARDEISNVINELKAQNELNGKLLRNSLEYVDFLMNLVTNSGQSTDNNYSNLGKLSENKTPRRRFDCKL